MSTLVDAVLIPGGGLTSSGEPPPWVRNRLDAAIALPGAPFLVALSRGTPHHPREKHESAAAAEYLRARGIRQDRILLDPWSLDTIGNAYFARQQHCEPRDLRRLMVITSAFHMPRTRAVFEWVFGLDQAGYALEYQAVPDIGLRADVLAAREAKEAASLRDLQPLLDRITSMEQLRRFLFTEHAAYAPNRAAKPSDEPWADSY